MRKPKLANEQLLTHVEYKSILAIHHSFDDVLNAINKVLNRRREELLVVVRKPTSISMTEDEDAVRMVVICDDGSMWYRDNHGPWDRIDDIPQDKTSSEEE